MCALAAGCNMNKKKDSSTMPMKSAALDIPAAPPAAPAAQYTPPPQPVVADPPQAQQPVIGEAAVADASESAYAAPESPAPSRKISSSARSSSPRPSASASGTNYTLKPG